MKMLVGLLFILVSGGIIFFVLYTNSKYSNLTREYSPYTLLTSSWHTYKESFIDPDGRVIDYSQEGITTSEGQSYALLRAVWMDDRETFDLVWKWTQENLKRPDDNLFGWKWGKRSDNTYGFMPDGGNNSASDADQDIALALIFASSRWSDVTYRDNAKEILTDLWKINTTRVNGKQYLLAGNWANSQTEIVLNPSYFAPYAWRIFARIDKTNDWESLIIPAYDLLSESSTIPLDKEKGIGLPPDWVTLDKETEEIRATKFDNLTTNYSFDAIRVPFRISLDYAWNKSPDAEKYLQTICEPLIQKYEKEGKLVSGYEHDGNPLSEIEHPAMYATAIGCFKQTKPALAKEIYETKILRLYANDQNSFRDDIPYYEQNLLWFGAALYNDTLIPYDN